MNELLDYIKEKRKEQWFTAGPFGKETDLDKARGTTRRMHNYCRKVGIDDVPDLDRVWKT